MIYFTSDTHFNHDRGFVYLPRGFNSVKEADNEIIKNWNSIITNEDDIYVLGDFFLGSDINYVKETLAKLNGKIHLIIGNHDSKAKLNIYRDAPNIFSIDYATIITYKKRQFYLSHYPTMTADYQSHPEKAIFNLFGHTHSKDKFYNGSPYMYNVAVDANDNKPVSIDYVYNALIERYNEVLDMIDMEDNDNVL
jgi:calcineurin-like phosphoesterase family protein